MVTGGGVLQSTGVGVGLLTWLQEAVIVKALSWE